MNELGFTGAVELAGLVRAGHVSPAELVEAALRGIEALDPAVGAFVEVDAERALADAAELGTDSQRPFAGVPVAVKANTPVAGRIMHYSSRFLDGFRPDSDAYLVRRLRDAGFVIVGMTKLPEFGILPTTEPRHGGPARNPWNLERTPGGSSGGSAAAVAAGMVPLAHGNDGGGSIRIPAACCGLVGLKPSRGRISRGPGLGDSFLTCEGVLSRTVMDTAAALDVLAGYEVGDATWAPRPAEPYSHSVRRDPGRLRIALSTATPVEAEVDPECLRGLREAAELLVGLGHEVAEDTPAFPGPEGVGLFIGAFASSIALGIAFGAAVRGRDPGPDEIEPLSRALRDIAASMTSTDYLRTVTQLQALSRTLVAFFADYHVLMTPALGERPLPIGECDGCGEQPLEELARSARFTPYTAIFNVTGQPAISVPIGHGADGLPTAVQLVGHPLAEDTLLQLAAQIEAARPWADRRPELTGTSAA